MDIDNGFGEDTGLEPFYYEPLERILTQSQKRDFIDAISAPDRPHHIPS